MAIERTTSKAKIEVISRGGHLACKVLRVVESLILVSVLNRFLVHESSPGSTQHKNTNNGTTINHGECTSNMMQYMNDMQDMICDAYACSGREMMNKAVTWQTKHATGKMRCFRSKSI